MVARKKKETDLFRKLRNNPKSLLENQQLMCGRSSGKSSIRDGVFIAVLTAYKDHPRRMRGLYVHARKGRPLRTHRRRVSFLDA